MPELPEVEIYRRYFEKHALKQTIARVEVRDERVLGAIRKEQLARALHSRRFLRARRHGKHLFADAGDHWLPLHFGMTGDLAYIRPGQSEPRFARVLFRFNNGASLAFEDMRLFGVVDLTSDPDAYITEHGLGPDPLDRRFTLRAFRTIVATRKGVIKALLMSQDVIAGIGNLYADETLFQSGIRPRRSAGALSAAEVASVYRSMRKILREVIERKDRGADYPKGYLIHHRQEGDDCPRCRGTIRRSVVFGRTTYFCARHQK